MGSIVKANILKDCIKATSLKERGFSRWQIQQLCHMEGSPFYQIIERGAWFVDLVKLDRFLDKLAKEKGDSTWTTTT